MSSEDQKPPQPPSPPSIDRNFQFYTWQIIGVSLIALVPILALFGLFGETFETTGAASADVEVEVFYPTRYRYKMVNPIEVSIHNISSQAIPTVTVEIDESYISAFSNVSFTPSANTITGSDYVVELTDLRPGETKQVMIEIQGEQYGWHEGTVAVVPEGAEPVEARVETFVFP